MDPSRIVGEGVGLPVSCMRVNSQRLVDLRGDAMKAPSLTIGIEEEYQIIDPGTRELRSYITQILEASKLILREQVKAELHQSMVEVGTEVCKSAAEARAELVRLRGEIMKLAA